ncbi:MAG: aminodeoxychorismate synthase component I [Chloroflexi bacterium]|nr:MAG: aminodeoxychorismate synthase component I [Chloroflexota bacterium]
MNRYPLIEEAYTPLTATELFELIKDNPYSFFLDSGMDFQRLGRYSFLGSEPFQVMSSHGSEITLIRGHEHEVQHGNPFDAIGKLLDIYRLDSCAAPVPFLGGAVGYFSYNLCHFIERLPSTAIDDLKLPETYFAFYDAIFAFDHLDGRAYLVATGFPEMEERQRLKRARMRLEEMKNWLHTAASGQEVSPPRRERLGEEEFQPAQENRRVLLKSNFTREDYIKAVDRVREYIAAGDVFQVNLSQRFEADLEIPPYELYKRLRMVNPAPFASYLNFPGIAIVSASPERFLKVQGDLVETRPIKGTRPRDRNPVKDHRLAQELIHSAKDRAENIMIVDLERNDLGRVCHYDTVKVTELAILETFPTLFHLTSTIEGRLCQGKTTIDLLKATFPGGSITGAPKVRAMEIIDELEPTKRSVYTGSLGYLSFNGDLDINIVIRTFLIKEGRAYFQVGGGVIYDSDSQAEYMETLDKAKALIQALQLAPEVVVASE